MILLYHKVGILQHDYNYLGVTPKNFRYQLEYIKEYCRIVPVEKAKGDEISITFDDGFEDFYTEIYPYLLENEIPATIFITTGKIGSAEELWTSELLRLIFTSNNNGQCFHMKTPMFAYDFPVRSLEDKITMYHALRRICMKSEEEILNSIVEQLRIWAGIGFVGRKEYRFLTEREIKILSDDSLVTIGAHTHNHISLGAFGKEYQEKEIIRAKAALERITGKQVQYFSYPFGGKYDYNEKTIEILKQTGFRKGYTTLRNIGKDIGFEIPRIVVPNLGEGEFDLWFHRMLRKQDERTSPYAPKDKRMEYIGKLKDDKQVLKTSKRIAIFGAGARGKRLYQELKAYGKDAEIICFIDNDRMKQGGIIENKKIIGVEQIREEVPDAILVDSIWEKEIIAQLIQYGIEGIHWIID